MSLTPEEKNALEVVEGLIRHAGRVFLTPALYAPDGSRDWSAGVDGFEIPSGWQRTEPDPSASVLSRWRPGDGLAIVGGGPFDYLDVDPHKGGDASKAHLEAAGIWPTPYARVATPSGGTHDYVRSLRAGSRDGLLDGLDIKGGRKDGEGRGFVWLPPTERPSKLDGVIRPYTWIIEPMWDEIDPLDDTGLTLAQMVTDALRGDGKGAADPQEAYGGPSYADLAPHLQRRVDAWIAAKLEGRAGDLRASASWAEGRTDERGRGWEKLQADTALNLGRAARASWNALTLEQARAAFIASAPIGGKWTRRKVEDKWKQQWHRNAPLAWPFGETDPHEAQPPGSDGLPFGPADDGSPSTGDDGWDNLGTADDAAPSYRTRDYGVRRKARPELHVGSAALATEFLAVEIGRGPLSGMFLRDGSIVHVPREGEDGYLAAEGRDSDGPAQIRTITGQALSARVQLTFECFTLKEAPAAEEGGTPGQTKQATMFPTAAANVVVNAPDMLPNLRPLRAVTHTPLVRADGSILTEPGYDQATGLYHLPDDGLTEVNVPDEPTSDDVAAAVVLLDRVTADFRWAGEHDRANYYGLLLTPLLRQLAPPPYKLGAIGAPQPGSGKSLLASVLRIVHGGVFRSEMPDKEDEIRKQVSTILSITTAPVVTFDNVTGILRSSTLAGLLTSPRWDDRKLGTNEMLLCANDRLWTLTGNNVTVGGDLARRTLWVTIDPGVPDPHLRTGFGIGDLESWARAHRAELIGALLTLVRAWHVAGRPTQPRRGDSFARWVETVGGILAFAGVPGVFDDASSARQVESTDDNEWGTFLHAIRAVFGDRPWTVKELLAKVRPTTIEDITRPIPLDVLPVDLAERVHKSGGNVDLVARSLGRWLTNRDGRWAGRLCVRASARDGHLGARSYTVQAPAALRL